MKLHSGLLLPYMQTTPNPSLAAECSVSLDVCQSVRSLSLSVGILPYHCALQDIEPRLAVYFREKSARTALGDIEGELAALAKTLHEHVVYWGKLDLQPLVHVHPFLDVARCSTPSLHVAESEVKRLLETAPEVVCQYQWTLRTTEWLGDLAVHWQLLTPASFAHRYSLSQDSVVRTMQLAECGRLDTLCFLPEVLCLAVMPGKLVDNQVKIWCVRAKLAAEQLLEVVSRFTTSSESSRVYEVTDYLNRDARLSRDISSKRIETPRAGCSLSLSAWWRCRLWQNEDDRMREELYGGLKQLCKEYLQLENALAQLVCRPKNAR